MRDLPLPVLRFLRRGKWILARCFRYLLQMFYFLPIHKNRVLFTVHNGLPYSCNPKYISEYLLRHGGAELELLWGFTHPKKNAIPGIRPVRINSPAWFYYVLTASVIVTNVGYPQQLPKRKEQLLISTWHGGGMYKRIVRASDYDKSSLAYRIRCERAEKVDLFLSSSQAFSDNCIPQDFSYSGEVLCCGMPRNDLFFDKDRRAETARRVKRQLGIQGYIAVYAPTFRGWAWRRRTHILFPYQEALSALRKRFGGRAVILRWAHPGGKIADAPQKDVLDVTDYPDMQELLCAADMLITDYSSSMWDFALLGRPCLLYIPDLEEYLAQRGVWTPPEEWPGLVCRNDEALLTAISTLDEQACAEKAARHLRALGSYETGTATEQVCGRILQHIDAAGKNAPQTERTAGHGKK